VAGAEREDDSGVGALLLGTDLSGADLRGANLNGVVMQGGSLRQARLVGSVTRGARWLDVAFADTHCPDGERRSAPCAGFVVPRTGVERRQAEARVAWLRARPWPED
jgi:hypothetical protein